jgi:hypothetical protein
VVARGGVRGSRGAERRERGEGFKNRLTSFVASRRNAPFANIIFICCQPPGSEGETPAPSPRVQTTGKLGRPVAGRWQRR